MLYSFHLFKAFQHAVHLSGVLQTDPFYMAVMQYIKRIDKNRAQNYEMIAGKKWGQGDSYHLTVNTSAWTIKEITPAVAAFARRWFDREQKEAESK